MANTVKLKRSAVQNKVPTTGDLELGELALNTYDGNLFFKRDVSGTESVVKVATNTNLLSYTRVTSNTTAVTRQSYIADTSGGTFTITLPASPASGDWVTIADGASFQTTALTVGRNSSTIADIAENLSLNIEGVSVTFVYDGSTWEVFTQVGAQGGDGGSSDVTASSTTTFTNKTISGSSNTLSNIANSSLTNSSVTVNGTSISLGGSGTVTAAAGTLTGTTLKSTVVSSSLTSVGTLTDLTVTNTITGSVSGNAGTVTNGVYTTDTGSVTNTMLAGSIANNKLANSSVTVNGTSISLGGSGTVTSAAGTLTGTELNSTVVTSSLTSVGTLTGLTTSGAASITYTPGTTTGYALSVTGKDTIGGTGYFDFFKATNTTSGATNGSKTFRLNSTGSIEIINSAYTASIFNLSNTGDLVISGSLTMANRPAFRVVGAGVNVTATTTFVGTTHFTVDYNQGSYLNTTTGIFTAPIAGLYQVTLVGRSSGSASIAAMQVQKTSGGTTTTQVYIEWGGNSTAYHMGGSAIVKMAVNDTLKLVASSGTVTFDSNDQWSVAYIG